MSRARIRSGVGLFTITVAGLIAFSTVTRINTVTTPPMTVFQAIQVYAEALFWLTTVLTMTVGAYIGTRAGDRE